MGNSLGGSSYHHTTINIVDFKNKGSQLNFILINQSINMHWADIAAEKLIKRGGKHVIETGTSISGIPHIGNASDVIRGDAIRKALEEKGIKPRFIWISDDSDPFRKIPRGMESLKDYLGYPVHDIPDLDGCHENFVEHLVEPFLSDLREFGIEPETFSGTELYRKGALYPEIKTAIENSEEIVKILNRFRRDPLPKDFIPWSSICENCGRISTTRAIEWDGNIIRYVCEDTEVSGGRVKGCGFKGENDTRKGYGKLPWRIEWAARWKHFQVTCEPLGKEHATAGGSFWTSKIISRKIFGWEPPLPVIYEFFTLNGEKISSSKGNVITLGDWLKICEPEVLKFFMYKRLQKQRDINLRAIPNLIDEYDEAEKIYFNLMEGTYAAKRKYELAQIDEPRLLQVPFTLCAVLAQAVPDLNMKKIEKRLKWHGYGNFDLKRLERRIKLAKNWNENYGPEYLRFRIIEDSEAAKIREKLNKKQILCLRKIADELDRELKATELHKRIYEISREVGLEPSRLFEAIYLVLIGKRRGPKAASFILTLDKRFVRDRFR
ncbi:MAG: lysine--tRNA ligase [Candidatus Altiarchaeales archaeon ex4484_43]|nr:MAG: lysine--tRNA ligase [Candidatus Altiarchaeales archaeon ex4484_43]